ncbi:MAG: phospho-N-acetylmuramoyl-pentapeptide-transferase [Bacillota bacterium]|jgi:phospho-N-acetylmuramoyl-pentapeptide-transferase
MSSLYISLIFAAALIVIIGPLFIPLLRRLKFGQTIRADGPQAHLSKAGTPTMGGLLFFPAFILALLFWGDGSFSGFLLLFCFVALGLIGFIDDMMKVVWKRSLGLTAKQKLVWQFLAILIFLFLAVHVLGRGTEIIIPATDIQIDLGWGYYVIISIFLVFMVNAVNLTDGLDGLASGVSFFVFLGFALIAMVAVKNPPIGGANYHDLAVGAMALVGCCLGFLFYNRHPAKIFMGDTGSLALGGALAAFAVLTKTEFMLLLLGGVYFVEALSVVLQVASFKLTGRRIFKMSPLHHHFEMKGWQETKVARTFCLFSAIFVLISLLLLSL